VLVSAIERTAELRRIAASGAGRSIAWRLEQLALLRAAVLEHEDRLLGGLHSDIGKAPAEGIVTEVAIVVRQIDHVRRNLARWSRAERLRVPVVQRPGRAWIRREPLGVVLVVAPWNFPVYLTLMPTIAALSAGNCVLIKPSELAPATSAALEAMVAGAYGAREPAERPVAVEAGGPEVVYEALAAGVDHLFFTGSTVVGRVVAEAAARHLTPATLELGGKCPAIVDHDADLEVAASRIAWAKFSNAGQTCVAPDYVLVHEDVADALVTALVAAVRAMYGREPRRSPDYARIVDRSSLDRLLALLEDHGGDVVLGGGGVPAERYLDPTIVVGPHRSCRLLQEEIFGPILPVVRVRDMVEAVAVVRSKPDPLAVYGFASDRRALEVLEAGTRSGSFCANAALSQFAIDGLPFGGIGASGIGVSRGRLGFEALSQPKAVVLRSARPDLDLHLPPYSRVRSSVVRRSLGLPRRRRRRRGSRGSTSRP
jgi:aldehyde dehydrogenase (NAD+)